MVVIFIHKFLLKNEEKTHSFDDFDLDGNGFLCAAELKQCLNKLGEKVTDEEIDEMIKMCDEVLSSLCLLCLGNLYL